MRPPRLTRVPLTAHRIRSRSGQGPAQSRICNVLTLALLALLSGRDLDDLDSNQSDGGDEIGAQHGDPDPADLVAFQALAVSFTPRSASWWRSAPEAATDQGRSGAGRRCSRLSRRSPH